LVRVELGKNKRVHPTFDGIGTVTARALVKAPLLQQLKKSSRNILLPDDGKSFLYADYAQFEPGILAYLCNDEQLIRNYNAEDIYAGLSKELFGNIDNRKLCKIIFLAFMYGMSPDNLKHLIKVFHNDQSIDKSAELTAFFSKYNGLIPYKLKLEKQALQTKRVESLLGNHRKIVNNTANTLRNVEKRWLLSQRIQGTASLILKSAILGVVKDEEISYLFPMHDAALFQVPTEKKKEKQMFIEQQFKEAFCRYLPGLIPRITFESFS
jgi:DNA polymerase I-like protein with 3'-5' exonuclease and polymerase domains